MEKETIEYKGYTINTFYDEGICPREDDNLGTMVCFHGRYNLGDNVGFSADDFSGWDEMEKHIKKVLGAVVCLPLYLYDHSSQSISTESFYGRAVHAEWDSGRIGFIFATKEDIRENWIVKRVSKKLIEHTERILRSDVYTYDQYIQGNIFGFTIEDSEGNNIDSCGGYIGEDYYDEMVSECKATIDQAIKDSKKTIKSANTLG